MGILRRQSLIAALTANAVKPVPGYRAGLAAFFPGWLVGELAPHVFTVAVADAATHAITHRPGAGRGPRDRAGLALAGVSAAALTYLMWQSRHAQRLAEESLVEALGADYVEQLDAAPTPAELAVPWRRLVNPFRMREDQVVVETDIAYADRHGRRGRLDIYRPAAGVPDGGAPVLLQVHGGAWSIGDKGRQGVPLMQHMAAKGWVCVAINYRLAPRDAFPAQVVDVKRAIAWIRDHIESYGGDPDYIAITGGSAGGHLISLTALTADDPDWQPGFEEADTSVQAALPHYGVYDFAGSTGIPTAELMRDGFLAPRVMQTTWADHPERFEAASPILRITPDAPDFFVIHGVHDTMVHVEQARLFVQRLREISKRTVVYTELPSTQHAFDILPSIRSAHIVRAIDRYLHWHWNGYRRERAA